MEIPIRLKNRLVLWGKAIRSLHGRFIAVTQTPGPAFALAWSEKSFVFNAQSRIADFLKGNAPTFFLMEDRLVPIWRSDSDTTQRALTAFLFFALSVPCILYGVLGMIRVLVLQTSGAGPSAGSSAAEAGVGAGIAQGPVDEDADF